MYADLHISQPMLIMSSHGFLFSFRKRWNNKPLQTVGCHFKVLIEYKADRLQSDEGMFRYGFQGENWRMERDDPTVISQIPCQLLLTQLRHNFSLIYTPQELIISWRRSGFIFIISSAAHWWPI